jgi:hypothetical protein
MNFYQLADASLFSMVPMLRRHTLDVNPRINIIIAFAI